MLSVIIPSLNVPSWPLLKKTVDDLFAKAVGEIEVIVILDGYIMDAPLKKQKNLTVLHNPVTQGMRPSINMGAAIARGEYIMKSDDHCMFCDGFDKTLSEDCPAGVISAPRMFSLEPETWTTRRGPLDYLYLTYPYYKDDCYGYGFHGKRWRGEHGATGKQYVREEKRKDFLIDDILLFHGSVWFMRSDLFREIGGLQHEGYINHQESQELSFKAWLSGGRCIVNKKTWYAHLHKAERGYVFSREAMISSLIYSADTWIRKDEFKTLIENPLWWPLELWPEDWDNPKYWNYNLWHNATYSGRDDKKIR
jgi:glycosyltransferase involved in cell wall biosynthesis